MGKFDSNLINKIVEGTLKALEFHGLDGMFSEEDIIKNKGLRRKTYDELIIAYTDLKNKGFI
jgi:hypothetical protein